MEGVPKALPEIGIRTVQMVLYTGAEFVSPEEVRQQSFDFLAKYNSAFQEAKRSKMQGQFDVVYYIATGYDDDQNEIRWMQRAHLNRDTSEIERVSVCDSVNMRIVDYSIISFSASKVLFGIFSGFDEFRRRVSFFVEQSDVRTLILDRDLGALAEADVVDGIEINAHSTFKFSLYEGKLPQIEIIHNEEWQIILNAADEISKSGKVHDVEEVGNFPLVNGTFPKVVKFQSPFTTKDLRLFRTNELSRSGDDKSTYARKCKA